MAQSKKHTKSSGWSEGKSKMTSDEKSTRGKSTDYGSIMSQYKSSFGKDVKGKAAAFGAFADTSPKEYATILDKHGFSNPKKPVSLKAIEQFMREYGQDPRLPQGSFIESAKNLENLKRYEGGMEKEAAKKGLKGEAYGFSGGYGKGSVRKGKVRAGVSSDMDAKNEEALNNSGLLG
tara:strand:- start:4419 stop:4949 length:531 start_codon:yes stop_codon:yes gene_type:complete